MSNDPADPMCGAIESMCDWTETLLEQMKKEREAAENLLTEAMAMVVRCPCGGQTDDGCENCKPLREALAEYERGGEMKLELELIPMTCWGHNLRKILPRHDWEILQQRTQKAQQGICASCRIQTRRLECHEIWEYDDDRHVQKLIGVEGLCRACHTVKHYTLAHAHGREAITFAHFCSINGLSAEEGQTIVEDAQQIWHQRSNHGWTLDISWLRSQHIPIPEGY